LYSLALQKSLTYGRRQVLVVGSLLYIICRQERSPHLLIDFSDSLQVNVFALGHCFLQLLRLLGLQLPIVDPCLFIHRYSAQICGGENNASSINVMALRIVTRLKKDWIASGRRHDGVCAAALLISCRAHGLQTTEQHILEVFHISLSVLRSRLLEFRATPGAHLTVNQFNILSANDPEEYEHDPPSFMRHKRKQLADAVTLDNEHIRHKKAKKIDIVRNIDRRKLYTDMYEELLSVNASVIDSSTSSESFTTSCSDSHVTGNRNVDKLLFEATLVTSCDPIMIGGWNDPKKMASDVRLKEHHSDIRVVVVEGKSSHSSVTRQGTTFFSDTEVTGAMLDALISHDEYDDFILSEEEQKKRSDLRGHMYGSFYRDKNRKQDLTTAIKSGSKIHGDES